MNDRSEKERKPPARARGEHRTKTARIGRRAAPVDDAAAYVFNIHTFSEWCKSISSATTIGQADYPTYRLVNTARVSGFISRGRPGALFVRRGRARISVRAFEGEDEVLPLVREGQNVNLLAFFFFLYGGLKLRWRI